MPRRRTPSRSAPAPRRRTRSRVLRGLSALVRRLAGAGGRESVDVVSQFQAACRQPWAAGLAGGVGGLPPFLGQAIAHGEPVLHAQHLLTVAGCMLFSMATIFAFGRATFQSSAKAVGFVAAMELAMVSSGLWYVRLLTVVVVVGVNMVMTGAGIALAYEARQRRQEADARRQQTRARTRADERARRAAAGQARTPSRPPGRPPEPRSSPRSVGPRRRRPPAARPRRPARPTRRPGSARPPGPSLGLSGAVRPAPARSPWSAPSPGARRDGGCQAAETHREPENAESAAGAAPVRPVRRVEASQHDLARRHAGRLQRLELLLLLPQDEAGREEAGDDPHARRRLVADRPGRPVRSDEQDRFWLPVGPDCLRGHPEWRFALTREAIPGRPTTVSDNTVAEASRRFATATALLRDIDPRLSLYVASDTLHLMAGPSHDQQGRSLRENVLASATGLRISGGDW